VGPTPFTNQVYQRFPNHINAWIEAAAQDLIFKFSFQKRRCLILSNGFYGWDEKILPKQLYYFYGKDPGIFAFSGL